MNNDINSNQEKIKKILLDFELFSKNFLKIRNKKGEIVSFVPNEAQRMILKERYRQLRTRGKVRMVIPKARQFGVSTLISALGFWKIFTTPGFNAYGFAHDTKGTASIYSMIKQFHSLLPDPLKPSVGASNSRELWYDKIGSRYRVGTAGAAGMGRSYTNNFLHWSEVAYSPNQLEHIQGIVQTVPDVSGTEIYYESTSAGDGDVFARLSRAGLAPDAPFVTLFIPWFCGEEYTCDELIAPNEHERELLELHGSRGLTDRHLSWRRTKLAEILDDETRFAREYPSTLEEAFADDGGLGLISADSVDAAIANNEYYEDGVVVMGIDAALDGGDRCVATIRSGRKCYGQWIIPPADTVNTANRLADLAEKLRVKYINIDVGGNGRGVYDNLLNMTGAAITPVNFGGKSSYPDRYVKKNAEMYDKAREWFALEGGVSLSSLTYDQAVSLKQELCARRKSWDAAQRLAIESKDDLKKRTAGVSPDLADSFVLTFAIELPLAKVNRYSEIGTNNRCGKTPDTDLYEGLF